MKIILYNNDEIILKSFIFHFKRFNLYLYTIILLTVFKRTVTQIIEVLMGFKCFRGELFYCLLIHLVFDIIKVY